MVAAWDIVGLHTVCFVYMYLVKFNFAKQLAKYISLNTEMFVNEEFCYVFIYV